MGWFKNRSKSQSIDLNKAVQSSQQSVSLSQQQPQQQQQLQQQQQQLQKQQSQQQQQILRTSEVQQFQAQEEPPAASIHSSSQISQQQQSLQQVATVSSPQNIVSSPKRVVEEQPTEVDSTSLTGASYGKMPSRLRQSVAAALAPSIDKNASLPSTPTGIVMEGRGRLDTRDDDVVIVDRAPGKHGRDYDVEDFSKSFSRDDDYVDADLKEEVRATHLNSLFNGHLMKWKFEAEEGSAFIRIPAFFGALGLISTAVIALVVEPDAWTSHSIVMSVCVIIMAVFILILDGRFLSTNPLSARAHLRNIMTRNFNIFRFLWGRGLLYLTAGTLNVAQLWLITIVSGGIMILIGFIALIVGIYSSRRFASLRSSLADESFLLLVFSNYDADGDGYLIPHEFALLLSELGMELDDRYTLKAFNVIDVDNDRRISFEEFSHWWSSGYIERGRRRRDDDTDEDSYRRLD